MARLRRVLPVRVLRAGPRVASRRAPPVAAPCFALLALAPQPRPASAPLALLVREPEAAYRPRHPERTALYRLFDRHFDEYARSHEERFERASSKNSS